MNNFFFLGSICLLAIYVAWNLGANDVANSMGTSVGSKAITLKQAIIIAGILEFTGAVVFGHQVSATLATKVANPELFINNPQVFLTGMIAVLMACGLWLQIATSQGLPVASSHAVVGAIAGFSFVAIGTEAIDWSNIGLISLGWIITPVLSAIVAAILYRILHYWLLARVDAEKQLQEWIPWLSSGLVTVFGIVVLPSVLQQPLFNSFPFPEHTLALGFAAIAEISITVYSWLQLDKLKLLELKQTVTEKIMGQFQVISACFVAFAHGSNDVGNAIAPLAAIIFIWQTNTVPLDNLAIPNWVLILGGVGIVLGLAVQGKNVITTVGGEIIDLVPSRGFCAEIATATTILLASRLGLPVSTSHALVGSVIGIGLVANNQDVGWEKVKSIALAWIITLPIAAILSAVIFYLLDRFNFIIPTN